MRLRQIADADKRWSRSPSLDANSASDHRRYQGKLSGNGSPLHLTPRGPAGFWNFHTGVMNCALISEAGTSVDLNADALGFRLGQRIEAVPVLTVSTPAAAAAANSACNASVEVFDHLTGRTWSHQCMFVGLPAVQ
jgi:hypothetical protein